MSDRALKTRMASLAKETWSAAQQEVSKFKMYTSKKSLDGGAYKLFPVAQKRTAKEKRPKHTPVSYTHLTLPTKA